MYAKSNLHILFILEVTFPYPMRRCSPSCMRISLPAASLPLMLATSLTCTRCDHDMTPLPGLTMGLSSLRCVLTASEILRPIRGWPRAELPMMKGREIEEFSFLPMGPLTTPG